jgi:hypothetical protein
MKHIGIYGNRSPDASDLTQPIAGVLAAMARVPEYRWRRTVF